MSQTYRTLINEIEKLPLEKIGKVLSFVRYLEQELEEELLIDAIEENELHQLLAYDDFVEASAVLAKIKELLDD